MPHSSAQDTLSMDGFYEAIHSSYPRQKAMDILAKHHQDEDFFHEDVVCWMKVGKFIHPSEKHALVIYYSGDESGTRGAIYRLTVNVHLFEIEQGKCHEVFFREKLATPNYLPGTPYPKVSDFLEIETTDWNGDGWADLAIQSDDLFSHKVWQFNMWTFDPEQQNYKKTEGFEQIDNPQLLPQYKGYVTAYASLGCAGYCWERQLWRIVENRVVKLAEVVADGNGKFRIYRFIDNQPQLLEGMTLQEENLDRGLHRVWNEIISRQQ